MLNGNMYCVLFCLFVLHVSHNPGTQRYIHRPDRFISHLVPANQNAMNEKQIVEPSSESDSLDERYDPIGLFLTIAHFKFLCVKPLTK